MNKKIIALSIVVGVSFMGGCASAPKANLEQQMATLKSYPDNGVGFILTDSDSRKIYALSDTSKDIVAYRFYIDEQYVYYNALDIDEIDSPGHKSSTLRLKDGTALNVSARNTELYRCSTVKSCSPITGPSGYGPFKALYETDMNSSSIDPHMYKSYPIRALLPNDHGSQKIKIQSGSGYATIKQLFADRLSRAEATKVAAERQAQASAEVQAKARATRSHLIESEAKEMRSHAKIGTMTNCGQIFDVRLPMVGVQTSLGVQYIQLSTLYGPNAGCHFINGVYSGPTN